MKCERKKCEAEAEYKIGGAGFLVCKFHADAWLAVFKKEREREEMRQKYYAKIRQ